jgi:glycosyltransferase involved in cell wall biosynthesis
VEEELRAQITRLHLDPYVIMPGSIPQEEIPGVYGLIDIVVCPRRSIRLTEVVTPLKPLEAMAVGKTVVASDVGGHRELIHDGETGLLFTADSVSALVERLTCLLDNDNSRHEIGARGREWVCKERTWDKTAAGYVEAYAKVLH